MLYNATQDKEDAYQLGRDLRLEADDLLPLIDAADLLDLADPQEGDRVLTKAGKRFAEADVLEEKQIFREQTLSHYNHACRGFPGEIVVD